MTEPVILENQEQAATKPQVKQAELVVQNSAIFANERDLFNLFSPQPLLEDIGIKTTAEDYKKAPMQLSHGILMKHEAVTDFERNLLGADDTVHIQALVDGFEFVDYLPDKRIALYQRGPCPESRSGDSLLLHYTTLTTTSLSWQSGNFLFKTQYTNSSTNE
jgi:hypothetical protein